MIILPAIDILGGKCVRLFKGEYGSARRVAESAVDTIKSFYNDGARYVHLVDLDGAKDGKDVNTELFFTLRKSTDAFIELGGGIRNIETVRKYLDGGIDRVILGSAAVKDPEFLKRAVDEYGEKISVGIDAKNGFVSTSGWLETGNINYIDFAKEMEKIGVSNIIFTDIGRDGTLEGPNTKQLFALRDAVNIDITASGGIKDIADIKALCDAGLYGTICGRSLYDGTLSLKEALSVCGRGNGNGGKA